MKYRRRKRRKKGGFSGFAGVMEAPKQIEQKHLIIGVLSAIGGNIIGAGLGKYSFWGGALVSGIGVATKNMYLSAAGAGMLVNTINKTTSGTNGIEDEEMEGLSMDGAKERVKQLFDNYKNRLMLKSGNEPVNGLGDTEGQVRFFHNPYEASKSSLDLSQLDRIQEQVAALNETNGLADIDPTEINF